ncbi:MAG: lamin tail domain-containing protein, partial [Phycisphaerae bacterium]|nr:lamin tail domain-containing protein [Phycisphaerae bacterium]
MNIPKASQSDVPLFESLEPRLLLSGSVVISEFMASNDTTLLDGDGNSSDWIELHNPTAAPVDLGGWFLTDDAAALTQWEFPTGGGINSTLEPGEYRIIFASGEDDAYPYVDPLGYLHTNFKLSTNDGSQHESVLLVRDDTTTIEHGRIDYPEQYTDVSYGIEWDSTASIALATGDAVRVVVPDVSYSGTATAWTELSGYDDSAWLNGATGVGFDTTPAPSFDSLITLDIGVMEGLNTSAYMRIPFTYGSPTDDLLRLTLNVKYDDGFVAYINGVEVARANAPASPAWDSSATDNRPDDDALEFESFIIDAAASLIQTGSNMLAIHGLSASIGDGDFLIAPELAAVTGEIGDLEIVSYFANGTPDGPNVSAPGGDPLKRIVINELHVNPDDNTKRIEFIELYNNTDESVDLSDWYFSDGVEFTFPADTIIAPRGYLVVGEDPGDVQSEFGISGVLGPFAGSLNNEGESVVLRNSSGTRQDEVDYGWGFPWPTTGGDPGHSMELINPNLDNDLGGSWRSSLGSVTTAGAENSVFAANAAPQTRQVRVEPDQPASGQATVLTAKVTDPNGVAAVDLHYQFVLPGAYIPAYLPLTTSQLISNPAQPRPANPAFEAPANWTTVVMVDDGTGADATAGDDIYTATIPAQINRTLVRYRITVTDTLGASVRAPYTDDPSLNFAYYVYDGVPDYTAGTRSIAGGAGHVYDSDTLTSLPVYSLIARGQDMVQMMAYDGSNQVPQTSDQAIRRAYNWQAAFVYDGVVYDHLDMRLRGANGRYYQAGKRSMRIKFKRGHYLQARDENGVEYPTKWRQLVVSKMFGNKNDANYGLSEAVNSEMWNLVGVPAPETHWFHFRVVDGAEEAPTGPNAQYYGDFWGMFMAFEPYDVRFLEAHDLPKGNLYKLTNRVSNGNLQQRYQAADAPSNAQDYNNIRSSLNSGRSEDWLHNNVNYDQWYLYHAIVEAVRHYDYWPGANKNMAWYFEPDETNPMGRLWYLPYDSDASWGPTWNGGIDEAKSAIYDGGGKPAMKTEYRNVIREIRDLLFVPEVINPWIDRTAAVISDFWQADYDRWEDAPSDAGRHNWNSNTLWWKVADMKQFAFVGGSWPGGSVGGGGQAAYLDQLANAEGDATSIPDTPTVAYTGPAGFAIDSLTFQSSEFSDPQGDETFAAMEWRIGEITDPGAPAYDPEAPHIFEYTAVWESGELTGFNDTIAIPGFDLTAGRTYRVRVRMKDTTGRWSHWSAPVQLVTGDADPYILDNLRITELNYNPYEPAPDEFAAGHTNAYDFEFVELQNTGTKRMDLTGVSFVDGITFDFAGSGVTSLSAGERVVIAGNTAAFEYRYGAGINLAGAYDGFLSNGGELVMVTDAYNRAVVNFAFNDAGSWPGRADAKGAALEIIDSGGDYNDPTNWRSSAAFGGTPGDASEAPLGVVINEVLSHTDLPDVDSIELYNTTGGTIDIGGWYLSDSWGWASNPNNGDYKKFRIPDGTSIDSGEYLVFDETDFNSSGGVDPLDFALSGAHGDDVWLMKADGAGNLTHFGDHVDFGAAANGESFGRWPNAVGNLYPMTLVTLYGTNSPPRFGPVIISEVMYNPPDPDGVGGVDPGDLEFIELYNPTLSAIELAVWTDNPHAAGQYLAGWRLRGGVDMEFDEGTTIAAGGTLVVLSFNPNDPANAARVADFRTYYGIDTGVPLTGGYGGRLDNGGDRISLQQPDSPPLLEPGFVPHVVEDEIEYDDIAPWPIGPDGYGDSLHRVHFEIFGGDGGSWRPDGPNPGVASDFSMPPIVVTPVDDVAVDEDSSPSVRDVSATFDDPDPGDTLTLSVSGNTNPGLVTTDLTAGILTLSYVTDINGTSNITVRATDQLGGWVEDTIAVTVNPTDDPPNLANPVANVTVYEDADDTVLDLSVIFDDPDIPLDTLVFSVTNNSDTTLVTTNIVGEDLVLSYVPDRNGTVDITVRATDQNGAGASVEDTFTVTVDPVNDAPTVVGPINGVIADEDDPDTIVDLANVFDDPDLPIDTLSLTVSANSNPDILTANVIGTNLTLSFLPDQNGTADIAIRATDSAVPGLWVEDTFTVTVNPINDAPVMDEMPDRSLNEDTGLGSMINLWKYVLDTEDEDRLLTF